jgi:hypothetical protein
MIDLGWTTRHIAKRDTLAVVVIDVEVTATAEDFDRVVAEVRAAKGWESERKRIAAEMRRRVESVPCDESVYFSGLQWADGIEGGYI